MSAAELIALAERCEAATGPDEAISAGIEVMLQRPLYPDAAVIKLGKFPSAAAMRTKGRRGWRAYGIFFQRVRYTSSFDAAMTLVPVGLSFEVRASGIGDKGQALVWDPMTQPGFSSHRSWRVTGCASPALALCAAALRARAASAGQ